MSWMGIFNPFRRVFRESLPPMRPTRDLEEVTTFLHDVLEEIA